MAEKYEVCSVDELPPGERKIVEVSGLSIGVFNLNGEYYALNNACPHQLADLCKGRLTGVVTSSSVGEFDWERDGQIIQCPWHHWEFDITTGESVFNPHLRARTYDTEVESKTTDGEKRDEEDVVECDTYGTTLQGDEPPVETYSVEVEEDIV